MKKEAFHKPLQLEAKNHHASGTRRRSAGVRSNKVLRIERWLLRRLLATIGYPPIAVTLWNGEEVYRSNSPVASVAIHDRSRLWKLLATPEIGFGDGYVDGSIAVEGDLLELAAAVNRWRIRVGSRLASLESILTQWVWRPSRNTLRDSRKNIYHHYDIGNDFYRLWLDEEMVYTCAYFPTPTATLEQAQVAKMEHICRKLQLRPGQVVVEAGCGWGALARYMARQHGVTVKAFNISHEQIAFARERAKAQGLARQVEFIEDDYRSINGTYDVFVSVGMLEHVGVNHYSELGQIIHRCLKPQGLGLIHTIGRDRPAPNSPWIERRIFPGSYPPSLGEMRAIFEPNRLSILDVENLRLHYAKTLQHWRDRFEQAVANDAERYDERFVRAWKLYLTGSTAAFVSGSLQLFQVLFTHAGNNQIPWTRNHIYSRSERAQALDEAIT
ncbi:MAG: class I SAM-dependent methyltransferase [Gammaproteobacteria bacterium]